MNRCIKARKAGITAEVVEEIKSTWRFQELAMVKIVDPLKRNMHRAHEIAEVGNIFFQGETRKLRQGTWINKCHVFLFWGGGGCNSIFFKGQLKSFNL